MDTPRRWQVASLATAVVSMGLGGLAMGRWPSQAVEPIELEVTFDVDAWTPGDADAGQGLELVPPGVLEVVSAASPASVDSPDESDDAGESPAHEANTPPPPAPTPTPPASTESPDSPDSPASADSADSAD